MSRRVAVTGIGVVTSLGLSTAEFWAGCLEGRSVVAAIPENWREFADYHSGIWSPLPPLGAESLGASRVELAQNDPVSLMAANAAMEALSGSGLSVEEKNKRARTSFVVGIDPARAGVYMGTGIGGASTFLQNHSYQSLARQKQHLGKIRDSLGEDSRARELDEILTKLVIGPRFNPFVVSMLMPNAVSSLLGLKFTFTGPNVTYTIACASGTVAIGNAFRAIRDGDIDIALAGGSEYLDDHYGGIFLGFDIAGALVRDCDDPDRANRPFDERRSGFLFSQGGAAVLVLEDWDRAIGRGAAVLAEVAGYGESFDAHSMMQIDPEGVEIERMIRTALDDARIGPRDIQYVNAHGTGTQANDPTEAAIIERVFGREVMVNSTKSLLGHTIGASGAIEAAVTALSLKDQLTHGCRNLERPIAALNFVRSVEPRNMSAAFTQSFAFGGHNAGLVLRRFAG
ncbi:MAG TPA: beta-ketoacyl-[acyl-carrier-protein] synthase family protein [Gammaproteobacteria bacterium]|nr:beta-ketoacyl-[acyl-carrier-protein] synthase family protein [Gammaproteobacteria bacterium]